MRYVVPLLSVTVNDVPVAVAVYNDLVNSMFQRPKYDRNTYS
jgi:hypothetical protein